MNKVKIISVVSGITLIILFPILLYFYRRDSLSSIFNKSVTFKQTNRPYIDSLVDLLNRLEIKKHCEKITIQFFWKQNHIDIGCNNSNETIIHQNRPDFIRYFFLENDGNFIFATKDGILFYTLYHSYNLKKFSLKYFYEKHNLKIDNFYMDKYLITSQNDIGKQDLTCSILDDHWILISRNE